MKILAFMQNQWFNDPNSVEATMARARARGEDAYWDYRRRIIAFALFRGCHSGRVLRRHLGDLCDTIHWEEASPKCGGKASSVFPADIPHMQKVIELVEPNVIIYFGQVSQGVEHLLPRPEVRIFCPHPAARGPEPHIKIAAAAQQLQHMKVSPRGVWLTLMEKALDRHARAEINLEEAIAANEEENIILSKKLVAENSEFIAKLKSEEPPKFGHLGIVK